MRASLKLICYVSSVALAAGCSSGTGTTGGGGGGMGNAQPDFSNTDDVTSELGGIAAYFGKQTLPFMQVRGQLSHRTGATRLSDDNVTMDDRDGVSTVGAAKRLSDSTSTIVIDDANFAGSYDYVRPYTTGYDVGNTREIIKGIYGITTQPSAMPSGGSATYVGDANADVSVIGAQYTMVGGKSTVTANFGTGKVDVTANGFTAIPNNGTATPTTTAPIDGVRVTGMTISGNRFAGGAITSQKNGADVDILGAGAVKQAAGNFYGSNAAGTSPDEVGGMVYMAGANGIVQLMFLAD